MIEKEMRDNKEILEDFKQSKQRAEKYIVNRTYENLEAEKQRELILEVLLDNRTLLLRTLNAIE